jgi:hypothetical protein
MENKPSGEYERITNLITKWLKKNDTKILDLGLGSQGYDETFTDFKPHMRLALLLLAIMSEYTNLLFGTIPKLAYKFRGFGITYPYDGPIVYFVFRDPKKLPLELVHFQTCARNSLEVESTNKTFDGRQYFYIGREMDIFRFTLKQYEQPRSNHMLLIENLIRCAVGIMEYVALAYTFKVDNFGTIYIPRIIYENGLLALKPKSWLEEYENNTIPISHPVLIKINEFNMLYEDQRNEEKQSRNTETRSNKDTRSELIERKLELERKGAKQSLEIEASGAIPSDRLIKSLECMRAEIDLLEDQLKVLDGIKAPYEVDEVAQAELEPVKNSEKKKPGPKNGTRKPNEDEEAIIKAINDGYKKERLCKEIDLNKIGPRKPWTNDRFPWPGSYVKAWNTRGEVKLFWHNKIRVYKSNLKRDFPKMFKITKSPR